MKKVAASLVLGVAACVLAWRVYRVDEPSYHGKTLGGWLEEYNRAGSMDKTSAASEAIRAMGQSAFPYLLGCLTAEDPPFTPGVLKLARQCHIHWLPAPRTEPPSVGPALLALEALGRTASPAIPQLARMFENPGTCRRGGLGLYSIGPAAIPAFEQACGSTNAVVRIAAASFLATMPSSYNDDQDYDCLWYKFDAWSKPQAYVVMPHSPDLILRLAWRVKNHTNPNVRRACVEALASRYGTALNDQAVLLSTLRKACTDPEAGVEESAKAALGQLEADLKSAGATK